MKWPVVTIDEITQVVTKGTTPTTMGKPFTDSGVTFVKAEALNGDVSLDEKGFAFIDDETHQSLKRSILHEEDILVTIAGAQVGRCGFVRPENLPANTNQAVGIVRVDQIKANPRFVYYFFKLPSTFALCQSIGAAQAAQPNVNLGNLRGFKVVLPNRAAQDKIADTLTAYDDLMENNRRRMALLEESARLLYREWFVHLRFPGHEHTRLTHGVPQGWEQIELNSIINVTHGYAFQGADFSDDPTSRVLTTPGNFRIGGGIKIGKPKFYSEAGPLPPDYILAPMDLIVTMTDLSKDSDTLGYPAFVPKLPDVTFLHNQRVGKVVPRGDFFPKHFLYFVLCDERYRHHVVGAATGGVIKHTSPKRILSYKADLPRKRQLIEDFEAFAAPLFAQINILVESNEKLRTARDLLLPRLMSGEIEV